jgi:hypothetical protein
MNSFSKPCKGNVPVEEGSGDVTIDYEKLWAVLEDRPSLELLHERLATLKDDDLKQAAVGFLDARTELVSALAVRLGKMGASEDILDDLAGVLIREGRSSYSNHINGTGLLPPREAWGHLEEESPVGAFSREVEKRFKLDVHDLWEAAVDQ